MAEKIEKSGGKPEIKKKIKDNWEPYVGEGETEPWADEMLAAAGIKNPHKKFFDEKSPPETSKGQAMPDLSSPEEWKKFGERLATAKPTAEKLAPISAPETKLPAEKVAEAPAETSAEKPKEFAKIIPATEAKTGGAGEGRKMEEIKPGTVVMKEQPLRESGPDELRALSQLTPEEKEIILEKEDLQPAEEPREKKLDEIELARKGAEITLYKITNYEELNAKTEQEGDEKFLQKTRELWKEFAVHGLVGYDKEGHLTITNETDTDGKGCLLLMQLAGFDISDLKYIKHGDYAEDRIYFDVGEVHGVVLVDGGKKVFIDHHTDESGKESSVAQFTYELLKSTGLLKSEKYLDNLVDFVTKVDNKTYFSDEKSFRNSWRTIYGLYHYIDFPKIVEFFQAGVKPGEILSEENLKKFGLEDDSKRQAITIRESVKHMQRTEKGGLVVPSERFGKIVVDIEKRVGAGFDAVRAFGYQTYLIWSPKSESFFITSNQRLDKEKIGQGKPVRGYMWIKPRGDGQPLTVKLADVLNLLTDGKFEPTLKLKEFIEKEQKEMEIKQLLEPKKLEILEKFGKEFYNSLKEDASWKGYDEKREQETLRIQTEVFLAATLKEVIKEDEVEKIVGYLIEKIKQ